MRLENSLAASIAVFAALVSAMQALPFFRVPLVKRSGYSYGSPWSSPYGFSSFGFKPFGYDFGTAFGSGYSSFGGFGPSFGGFSKFFGSSFSPYGIGSGSYSTARPYFGSLGFSKPYFGSSYGSFGSSFGFPYRPYFSSSFPRSPFYGSGELSRPWYSSSYGSAFGSSYPTATSSSSEPITSSSTSVSSSVPFGLLGFNYGGVKVGGFKIGGPLGAMKLPSLPTKWPTIRLGGSSYLSVGKGQGPGAGGWLSKLSFPTITIPTAGSLGIGSSSILSPSYSNVAD